MAGQGLYHAEPPVLQTKGDMTPTLLIGWWCTGFALTIIVVRVAGRYIRTEKLFREDKIMAASIIPLMIRMGLVHPILLWGTNNTVTEGLSAVDVQHRQIGSKLVLASRIFYAAFIWTAKLTVLEFLKRIVGSHWRKSFEIGLQLIRYFLLVTFIGVVIATLAECQPFDHYWQVIPDPGPQCREGVAQLLTMGTCDIITDLLLVLYPTPIVIMSGMPMKRKISLILLFALSLALVAITAYRIPSTINRGSAQQYRSLLASLEILAAAGVSNSIVIGSFIRDRGAKKVKYRRESVGEPSPLDRTMTRRTTIAQNHWGSDSDLAGDVGMALAPDLQSRKSSTPSMAPKPVTPIRDSSLAEKGGINRPHKGEDDISSISTGSTDLKSESGFAKQKSHEPISQPSTPRKMSFFDVGNLMANDEKDTPAKSPRDPPPQHLHPKTSAKPPSTSPQQPHNPSPSDFSTNLNANTIIHDIGGLLSPTRTAEPDRSTALPPTSRQLSPSPPSLPQAMNRSRSRTESTSQRSSSNPQPPPPSYRPRSSSSGSPSTQWNATNSNTPSSPNSTSNPKNLDIIDAGGLLKSNEMKSKEKEKNNLPQNKPLPTLRYPHSSFIF